MCKCMYNDRYLNIQACYEGRLNALWYISMLGPF